MLLPSEVSVVEERANKGLVAAGFPNRLGDGSSQLQYVVGNEVSQVGVIGVAPDLFHWVELRRVGRQPFDLHAAAETLLMLPNAGLVNLPAIPHQDNTPADASKQAGHALDEIVGNDVMVEDIEVEPRSAAMVMAR